MLDVMTFEKVIRSINIQWNRKNNDKVTVNSKYYREHQRSCSILIFAYLMAPKLLYLLMDWEIFNSFMTRYLSYRNQSIDLLCMIGTFVMKELSNYMR